MNRDIDRLKCSERRGGRVLVGVVLVGSVAIGIAVAVNERSGTRANVEGIDTTRNLFGGFLAVGMSADQPGIVVLSALGEDEVTVHAEQVESAIAGTYTNVRVKTPGTEWRKRLRGPLVVTVGEDGSVTESAVDWTLAEFRGIRDGADCPHSEKGHTARCGDPFGDLEAEFAKWPRERVPGAVREFFTTLDYPKGRRPG